MTNKLRNLAAIGGPPIRATSAGVEQLVTAFGKQHADALLQLLKPKNGFYAFEGALHVLSDAGSEREYGIVQWNSANLWRSEYANMIEGCVFFAEDVFGNQFCLLDGHVFAFDPETGELKLIADSMQVWAQEMLDDYELWTGCQLAHEWQKVHGAIPIGSRLIPATPFVLGGDYAVANLHSVEAAKGMNYRASIAAQIRDLPDGAAVKLKIIE